MQRSGQGASLSGLTRVGGWLVLVRLFGILVGSLSAGPCKSVHCAAARNSAPHSTNCALLCVSTT
jgi:hypothetical protein